MNRSFSLRAAHWLATGFYSGLAPVAPGTAGSAVAAVFLYLLFTSGVPVENVFVIGLIALITTLAGIPLATAVCRAGFFGENKDPGPIVIDEFAGMFVTCIGISLTPLHLFVGFLAFRLFDITKPYPANRLEKLPEGTGIMLDDIAAGIYANLLLRAFVHFVS